MIKNGAETKHLNSTRTARPFEGPGSSSRIQMLRFGSVFGSFSVRFRLVFDRFRFGFDCFRFVFDFFLFFRFFVFLVAFFFFLLSIILRVEIPIEPVEPSIDIFNFI